MLRKTANDTEEVLRFFKMSVKCVGEDGASRDNILKTLGSY